MRPVFKCTSCGKKVERNILPGKHAINGCIRKIEAEEECCSNPDYTDMEGYASEPDTSRQRIAAAV